MDFTQQEIEEGKSLAWLSYLGIFFVVPLITQKDNRFTLFHVRQGVALFGLSLVLVALITVGVVIKIMLQTFDAGFMACCFDSAFGVLELAMSVVILVLSIIGIVKALSGEAWEIPVLGKIAQKITFI